MKCSCCINTYKRPLLLKKLLDSLNEQVLDEKMLMEIIVVDNDPDKQAEEVVSEASKYLKFPIFYFTQPEKNISLTRNVAVKNASGEFIAFIDDDGFADKNWIKTMFECVIKYNADAAFGRVVPYFGENTPKWIVKGGFFRRPCPPTGNKPGFTRTGNCLIKSEILRSIEGPFDPNYGLTGGSDTHLFELLLKNNAKFVSCCEGIVYDYIHPERANFKWMVKRAFRTGNSFTRRNLEFSENVFIKKIGYFFKASFYGVISITLIILSLFSMKYRVLWTLKLAGNIGHLFALFNYHYKEYQN